MVVATQTSSGRREQILEATLRVIGRSGREAVTHRAVAQEAGVPLGSTTYYFDSRDDLLGQALEHVARRETERYAAMAGELRGAKTPRQLADMLLSELWLEASRRPELRDAAQAWCAAVQLAVARAMEKLGSTNPAADASLVVAAIDGLGERVLGREEDLAGAAAEFRPQLR